MRWQMFHAIIITGYILVLIGHIGTMMEAI